jgi:hypothetical protein
LSTRRLRIRRSLCAFNGLNCPLYLYLNYLSLYFFTIVCVTLGKKNERIWKYAEKCEGKRQERWNEIWLSLFKGRKSLSIFTCSMQLGLNSTICTKFFSISHVKWTYSPWNNELENEGVDHTYTSDIKKRLQCKTKKKTLILRRLMYSVSALRSIYRNLTFFFQYTRKLCNIFWYKIKLLYLLKYALKF